MKVLASCLTLSLLLASCVSSVPYSKIRDRIPQTPEGQGRLLLVAAGSIGGTIYIDDAVHSELAANTFTLADLHPGQHHVRWVAGGLIKQERKADFAIAAGEETCLKATSGGIGFIVIRRLERYDPVLGWARIREQNLGYVGPELPGGPREEVKADDDACTGSPVESER